MQSSPNKKNKTLPGLEAPIPLEAVNGFNQLPTPPSRYDRCREHESLVRQAPAWRLGSTNQPQDATGWMGWFRNPGRKNHPIWDVFESRCKINVVKYTYTDPSGEFSGFLNHQQYQWQYESLWVQPPGKA